MPIRHVLVIAILWASGCAAGIGSVRVGQAKRALVDAEERGAVELAPYEHTLARLYLSKAAEQVGEGQHKVGIALAKQARQYAEEAVVRIEGGGRAIEELREAPDDLSDDPLLDDAPGDDEAPEDERAEDDEFDDFIDDGWEE